MLKYFIVVIIVLSSMPTSYGQSAANKNNIKFELPNMLYGDYSITYERFTRKNSSLNFRLGYLQPFNRIFKKYEIEVEGKKNGFDTSLEYRFYFSKKHKGEMIGFYIAPYARYASLNLNFIDDIQASPFSVDFKYSNIGIGAQLGAQGKLKSKKAGCDFINHIVYDFHILGAGVDRHQLKMTYKKLKDPEDFNYDIITDDIEQYFEKVPFLSRKLDFGYLNSFLNVKLPLVLPGFRAGFSVGYSF